MADETSIKQMLVKIVRECVSPTTVEEGVITKRDPLAITLVNDKKMKLSKTDITACETGKGRCVGDRG